MSAVNFNGEGPRSVIAYLKSCTAPSLLNKPSVESVSAALVGVSWQNPLEDGGC